MMPANPPFGMVFACFMVAIMIGSSLYTLLLARGYTAEDTLRLSIGLVSLSLWNFCFWSNLLHPITT